MVRLTEEVQIGPFASLKDKAEAVPGAFGTYDCLMAHMTAVTKLKQYEDTGLSPEEIKNLISPPNPPLTLEDLKAMDKKPVWCCDKNGENGCWMLVVAHKMYCENYCDVASFSDYGTEWLAYCRELPKEIMAVISPPPNPSLTVDDLSRICGEEIYTTKYGWTPCYGVVDGPADYGPGIDIGENRRISLEGYGEDWWAYRQKPEKEPEK